MGRPAVGICAAVERARWAAWELEANLLPRTYTREVAAAGATALILPPDESLADAPEELLDRVDALVLAGGSDIDPASYGAEPDEQTVATRPDRDRFELALARGAIERGQPLLGICRGMEMLNVACGGTLEQHLPTAEVHLHTPGEFADHDVRLQEGSLAARAAGEHLHATKSHHHQGVDALGEGFVVTGWSTLDDLPEAIERPERRFALGVQWHPEADETSRLIASLVEEARSGV